MCDEYCDTVLYLFTRSRYFHSSSITIPSSLTVHAAVISSPTLRAQSSVLGSIPTLGFDIAHFINHYQVTHYTDVDLCTFPHQALTSSFELMHINLSTHSKTVYQVHTHTHTHTHTCMYVHFCFLVDAHSVFVSS